MADQDGRDEDQDFDAQINEEDIVDVIELEGEGGMKLKMSCNHNRVLLFCCLPVL